MTFRKTEPGQTIPTILLQRPCDRNRRMPRRPRIIIELGFSHVYNRFARGESVFGDPEEAIAFVDLLQDVKQRDGLTILAWAVLSDHCHVAVRTSAIPLSRTMKHLQGTYSRTFNRRWRRSGPLWQSRFKAKVQSGARHSSLRAQVWHNRVL